MSHAADGRPLADLACATWDPLAELGSAGWDVLLNLQDFWNHLEQATCQVSQLTFAHDDARQIHGCHLLTLVASAYTAYACRVYCTSRKFMKDDGSMIETTRLISSVEQGTTSVIGAPLFHGTAPISLVGLVGGIKAAALLLNVHACGT